MFELLQAEGFSVLTNFFDYGLAGAVIAASMLANFFQYKRNNKLQEIERESMIKVTELVTKTLTALQSNVQMTGKISEMIYILNDSKEHWKGLPDVASRLQTLIKLIESHYVKPRN